MLGARSLILCTAGFAVAAALPAFAQRQGAPRECRQQIVKLCGTDRATLRQCLLEKRDQLGADCKARLTAQRSEIRGSKPAPATQSPSGAAQLVRYGPDPLQAIDYYPAANGAKAPLVLFVHGGGWKRGDKRMMDGSAKLSRWREQGYAVASLNYRLVPKAKVEDQAADIAAGLAALIKQARRLGFDATRVFLVGHSAGAHLVALVGTDPQWLRGAGLDFGAVDGVIALDGAGYMVPEQMGKNAMVLGDTYEQAFGTDPVRQLALSPTNHAAAPNAPAFLILHVDRADAKQQSEGLSDALRRAGTPVELYAVPGRGLQGHMEINRKLGEADYPATAIVDRWLAARFR